MAKVQIVPPNRPVFPCFRGFFRQLVKSIVPTLLILSFAAAPSMAASGSRPLHIVKNDRGGIVSKRAEEIRKIAQRGARVEIQGTVCLSSCTMFLGAPDVCVNRTTKFGFHGPAGHGKPLTLKQFNYWSEVIARHYPKALARWYLRTARHIGKGYYNLTGAQLIQMGVNECRNSPKKAARNTYVSGLAP